MKTTDNPTAEFRPNPDHIYFAVPDLEIVFARAKDVGCAWLADTIATRPWRAFVLRARSVRQSDLLRRREHAVHRRTIRAVDTTATRAGGRGFPVAGEFDAEGCGVLAQRRRAHQVVFLRAVGAVNGRHRVEFFAAPGGVAEEVREAGPEGREEFPEAPILIVRDDLAKCFRDGVVEYGPAKRVELR